MKNEPQQIAPYSVRMDAELRRSLENAAKENSRSMHAEILLRLNQSFEPSQAGDGLITERQVREIVRDELQAAHNKTK